MIDHSPLTDLDRDIVGGDVRITVPIRDRLTLHYVAQHLRRLAQTLEVASKSPHMSQREALFCAKGAAMDCRERIKGEARKHGFDCAEGRKPDEAKLAYARKVNGGGTDLTE